MRINNTPESDVSEKLNNPRLAELLKKMNEDQFEKFLLHSEGLVVGMEVGNNEKTEADKKS